MDPESVPICHRKCRNKTLVRPIIDVDEPKIVILAVGPSAFRMVVILKPMGADDFGDCRKVCNRRRCAGITTAIGRASPPISCLLKECIRGISSSPPHNRRT